MLLLLSASVTAVAVGGVIFPVAQGVAGAWAEARHGETAKHLAVGLAMAEVVDPTYEEIEVAGVSFLLSPREKEWVEALTVEDYRNPDTVRELTGIWRDQSRRRAA